MSSEIRLFKGTFAHTPQVGDLDLFSGGIGVDSKGKIAFVARSDEELHQAHDKFQVTQTVEKSLDQQNSIFLPGFVDTHAHAPQYAFAGTAHGVPLLKWLDTYTFPTESKFGSLEFAKTVYSAAVNRKVKNGTTTTCWFATIHLPASKTLFDINSNVGARAFVGKVAMDRNSPEYYIEASASASLADTESLIQYCNDRDPNGLVKPIITPRFVGTCSPQLMSGLGELATRYDTHIQSHISESLNEVEWTISFHPELKTYGGIYDHFGLLTSKTIMAHGCWLLPEEYIMLKQRGVSIAHCPNSNFTLVSGLMDSRGMFESGVKFGLGTDVAGGFSPSMLDAFRCALHTSSARAHMPKPGGEAPKPVLSWREALYLMTQGGAESLSLGDRIGTFEVGKEFDAITVNHVVKNSPYDLFDMDTTTSKLEKFLFIGDDRNIEDVYVQGKRIGGSL